MNIVDCRPEIIVFLLMTPFPSIIILNGVKNALWERRESGNMTWSEESMTRMTSLTDSSGHLYPTPFKFMHAKRTHISASPFPLSAASYPPGPLPAKYFRRL